MLLRWYIDFSSFGKVSCKFKIGLPIDSSDTGKKRISDTLDYWKQAKFHQLLLPDLQRLLSPTQYAHIEAAFIDMCGMVAIAYTLVARDDQKAKMQELALDLRLRLRRLKAKPTVWGHIWTVHVPQFLIKWGTLYPFVCHGVEGKHRVFKADLRLSSGNQWKAGTVGFAQTLQYDRIRWELFGEGIGEFGRYRVSRKLADSRAFRKYELQMAELLKKREESDEE